MVRLFARAIGAYVLLLCLVVQHGSCSARSLSYVKNWLEFLSGGISFLQEGQKDMDQELPDMTPKSYEEYDFIVVGAGSAGSTIAARLSENAKDKVLLVEAGRNENLAMDIPLLVQFLQMNNDINWKYQTEPSDKYCLAMKDRKCNWPRGRVMGGTSILNYMLAVRGHPSDYDSWARAGNDGWSYNEVLKYFKKMEHMSISELQSDAKHHGVNGPLNIEYPRFHTPLAKSFLKAGMELGYPIVDYNGEQNLGFSMVQLTARNGTRASTNKAYLHPIRRRKNIFLSRESHVTRVMIDPQSRRAYGVEFIKNGRKHIVKARKEIILSAGTIGSAQILMLSGVGPANHLRDMNIKVIQDAPVGENLMDHVAYGGMIFLVDQPVSVRVKDVINPGNPYLKDWLLNRKGPYTMAGGVEALAFLNSDDDSDGRNCTRDSNPDLELLFFGTSILSGYNTHKLLGMSDEYWNRVYSADTNRHAFTILPIVLRPKSRGKILLRNSNPKSKPIIYANYMNDPEDARLMVAGIRKAMKVSKTVAMKNFNARLHAVPVPGCSAFKEYSDKYWECAARYFTVNLYHHSGTCKMGPEHDPSSVVNPRLQVIGIQGLRVADASIMPTIISGHLNIPVIMIGEKLSDMVKEDWGYRDKR